MTTQQLPKFEVSALNRAVCIFQLRINGANESQEELAKIASIMLEVRYPKKGLIRRLYERWIEPFVKAFKPIDQVLFEEVKALDVQKAEKKLSDAFKAHGFNLTDHPAVMKVWALWLLSMHRQYAFMMQYYAILKGGEVAQLVDSLQKQYSQMTDNLLTEMRTERVAFDADGLVETINQMKGTQSN